MKKILIALMLFLSAIVISQAQNLPVDNNTGLITYLRVGEATGLTAADLFKYTKEWAAKKGLKIKKEDAAAGQLEFEGAAPVEYPGKVKTENGNVNFNFYVFLKDGKYRYIAKDFVHAGLNKAPSGGKLEGVNPACGSAGMAAASWVMIKKKTQTYMEALNADFEKYIREIMNDPTKKSDW